MPSLEGRQDSKVYQAPCEGVPGQRGLFAAVAIPPGSEILSIACPMLQVVDSAHLVNTCDRCFVEEIATLGPNTEVIRLKTCQGCRVVRYCGKTCQEQAWKAHHKHECRIFARLQPRILPTPARALVRLLKLHQKGQITEADWAAVLQSQSHREDFKAMDPVRWQDMCLMSQGAAAYSGTRLSVDEVIDLCCKIIVNSMTLMTSLFDPIGLCMEPTISLINHSCAPNATVIFDRQRLALRSVEPVAQGHEITLTYVDTTDPYPRRQRDLRDRYFFACACAKCQHGPTLREDHFLPGRPPSPALFALEEQGYAAYDAAENNSATASQAIPALEEAANALRRSAAWPLDRQPWPGLRAILVVKYLAAQRWGDALKHLLVAYFHIDPLQVPRPSHPVRVGHLWRLACLVHLIGNLARTTTETTTSHTLDAGGVHALRKYNLDYKMIVWGLLCEADSNVDASHGADSHFARMLHALRSRVVAKMPPEVRSLAPPAAGRRLAAEWTKLRALVDEADGTDTADGAGVHSGGMDDG
ncbi:MAG: hypothetical protein M1826_003547 [Phylliscum demangeonii]|nr:MAG: hypothetical protein M1826_003547 [Phylliscum demangeonii]